MQFFPAHVGKWAEYIPFLSFILKLDPDISLLKEKAENGEAPKGIPD